MRRFVGSAGTAWVLYRTGDDAEDVIFYYRREMSRLGLVPATSENPSTLLWESDDVRVAIHVVMYRVQNHVILAAGTR